jgi:hypothetical protein
MRLFFASLEKEGERSQMEISILLCFHTRMWCSNHFLKFLCALVMTKLMTLGESCVVKFRLTFRVQQQCRYCGSGVDKHEAKWEGSAAKSQRYEACR